MAKRCSNPTYMVCRYMDEYGRCKLLEEEECPYQEYDEEEATKGE